MDSLEQKLIRIREELAYGGVLNVYIKRCSNLLIMSRQSGVLNVENYGLHYLNHWNIWVIWNQGLWREKGEGFLYGKDAIFGI